MMAPTGRSRTGQRLIERGQLRLHSTAGEGGQKVRDAFGRRMGTVRGGKRIVDVDVAKAGKDADESRIVLLFARMKARVVHQQDVAGLGCRDRGPMRPFSPIRGDELHSSLQALFERGAQRRQRVFGDDLAAGPLEVGEHDDDRVLVGEFRKRRDGVTHPHIVGDSAVLHGDVEVGADDDPLAGDINSVEAAQSCHWLTPPCA